MLDRMGDEYGKYIMSLYGEIDEDLRRAKDASQSLDLDHMSLSPVESKLLGFLVSLAKCETFVEIGTLTGFSALCIAKYLSGPNPKLYCLERDIEIGNKAQEVFGKSQVASRIELLIGDANETLSKVPSSVDGVFIDANKKAYPDYLDWAESHVKKGGLIIADNTFLGGQVILGHQKGMGFGEKQVEAMRQFNERLADPEKYQSIIIPTKEGMGIAIKRF